MQTEQKETAIQAMLEKLKASQKTALGVDYQVKPLAYMQKLKLQERLFANWEADENLYDDLALFHLLWRFNDDEVVEEALQKVFADWRVAHNESLLYTYTNPLNMLLILQDDYIQKLTREFGSIFVAPFAKNEEPADCITKKLSFA